MKPWLVLALGAALSGVLIATARALVPYWAADVGWLTGALTGAAWVKAEHAAQLRRLRINIDNLKATLGDMVAR